MTPVDQATAPLILIADDTVPTTTMLQRVFEYEGYQVHCVFDGLNALNAAREMLPDLILLDINMPGINGFEVLKRLREDPTTATIPTILITAMSDLSDIVQGLQLGADDYVRKPFHWRELLARAQSKMRARRLEEALQRRTQDLEALLVVSHALSEHLETSEVLDLVLRLTLELIGGDGVLIYEFDANGALSGTHTLPVSAKVDLDSIQHWQLADWLTRQGTSAVWHEATSPLPAFPFGMMSVLQADDTQRLETALIVVGNTPYDTSHSQLLAGISLQANLALRNAELYELKVKYALQLEDRVEERTSELRSAQHMLIRSEKLASIGRLAASIAHEINNPLLPIQINLDDMLEDLNDGKAIDPEEIIRTQESVERIRRIVNRLLEFTGNSYMTATLTRALDLNRLIENVCDLVRKSFEQKGQQIQLNLAPPVIVQGDKDGLEQVFLNLALNASQAMGRGGLLQITTSMDEQNNVVATVTDNGSGIPPEILEKMFEPFITTKEDGNGLGLFVSYGIIQNHRGSIEVVSEVGKGTTFTIKIPAAESAAPGSGETASAAAPKGKTGKKPRSKE